MSGQQPYFAAPPGPGIAGARDVVTGEAVALELRLARLPSRALALAVDLAAMAVLGTVVLLLNLLVTRGADDKLSAALVLVGIIGVLVGYPTTWETLTRGRSPGKMLLGLRVVRDDGGPVRFRHAFVRALLGLVVDFLPPTFGAIGVIASLCSAKGKRLGDQLAGTVVIRERVPAAQSAALPMPPQLAGWASGLQVGLLPDPLALEIRQLLGRLNQLDPAVAGQLLARLSAEVTSALAAPPPAGVDAYTHLHAVLAERRNRELARSGAALNGWHLAPPPGAAYPPHAPPPGSWAVQPVQPAQPPPTAPVQPWAQHPAAAPPLPAAYAPPTYVPAPAPAPKPQPPAPPPPSGPFAPPS